MADSPPLGIDAPRPAAVRSAQTVQQQKQAINALLGRPTRPTQDITASIFSSSTASVSSSIPSNPKFEAWKSAVGVKPHEYPDADKYAPEEPDFEGWETDFNVEPSDDMDESQYPTEISASMNNVLGRQLQSTQGLATSIHSPNAPQPAAPSNPQFKAWYSSVAVGPPQVVRRQKGNAYNGYRGSKGFGGTKYIEYYEKHYAYFPATRKVWIPNLGREKKEDGTYVPYNVVLPLPEFGPPEEPMSKTDIEQFSTTDSDPMPVCSTTRAETQSLFFTDDGMPEGIIVNGFPGLVRQRLILCSSTSTTAPPVEKVQQPNADYILESGTLKSDAFSKITPLIESKDNDTPIIATIIEKNRDGFPESHAPNSSESVTADEPCSHTGVGTEPVQPMPDAPSTNQQSQEPPPPVEDNSHSIGDAKSVEVVDTADTTSTSFTSELEEDHFDESNVAENIVQGRITPREEPIEIDPLSIPNSTREPRSISAGIQAPWTSGQYEGGIVEEQNTFTNAGTELLQVAANATSSSPQPKEPPQEDINDHERYAIGDSGSFEVSDIPATPQTPLNSEPGDFIAAAGMEGSMNQDSGDVELADIPDPIPVAPDSNNTSSSPTPSKGSIPPSPEGFSPATNDQPESILVEDQPACLSVAKLLNVDLAHRSAIPLPESLDSLDDEDQDTFDSSDGAPALTLSASSCSPQDADLPPQPSIEVPTDQESRWDNIEVVDPQISQLPASTSAPATILDHTQINSSSEPVSEAVETEDLVSEDSEPQLTYQDEFSMEDDLRTVFIQELDQLAPAVGASAVPNSIIFCESPSEDATDSRVVNHIGSDVIEVDDGNTVEDVVASLPNDSGLNESQPTAQDENKHVDYTMPYNKPNDIAKKPETSGDIPSIDVFEQPTPMPAPVNANVDEDQSKVPNHASISQDQTSDKMEGNKSNATVCTSRYLSTEVLLAMLEGSCESEIQYWVNTGLRPVQGSQVDSLGSGLSCLPDEQLNEVNCLPAPNIPVDKEQVHQEENVGDLPPQTAPVPVDDVFQDADLVVENSTQINQDNVVNNVAEDVAEEVEVISASELVTESDDQSLQLEDQPQSESDDGSETSPESNELLQDNNPPTPLAEQNPIIDDEIKEQLQDVLQTAPEGVNPVQESSFAAEHEARVEDHAPPADTVRAGNDEVPPDNPVEEEHEAQENDPNIINTSYGRASEKDKSSSRHWSPWPSVLLSLLLFGVIFAAFLNRDTLIPLAYARAYGLPANPTQNTNSFRTSLEPISTASSPYSPTPLAPPLPYHSDELSAKLQSHLPHPTPSLAPTYVPSTPGNRMKRILGEDCPTRDFPSQAPEPRTIAGYLRHVLCRYDLGQTINLQKFQRPQPTRVTTPWNNIPTGGAFSRTALSGGGGGSGNLGHVWSPLLMQGTVGYCSLELVSVFLYIFFFVLASSIVFEGILWVITGYLPFGFMDSSPRLGSSIGASTPSTSSSHPTV
jgi:hypothetical protein